MAKKMCPAVVLVSPPPSLVCVVVYKSLHNISHMHYNYYRLKRLLMSRASLFRQSDYSQTLALLFQTQNGK